MTPAPFNITLSAVHDFAAVETAWRRLEADAEPSFFQTWTWIGCLGEERFPDPVLLQAERSGRIVGLALLNRTRDRLGTEQLWMHQSGNSELDAIYVEHNGILLAPDASDLLPACIRALLRAPIGSTTRARASLGRRVRLAGIDAAHLAALNEAGTVSLLRESVAPFVSLADLPAESDAYLDSLSSNTRYHIRRSDRCFAQLGPLSVRRAETLEEGLSFLDALAALHQVTWTARGVPGAFANSSFLRFHRALIARALPRGEVELLRVAAAAHVLGYLYNFRLRDRVYTYQSGIDYVGSEAIAGRHAKPGLTCHHAAILGARSEGAATYDFLAGPDRYKTSLAHSATTLYWLDVAPRYTSQSLVLSFRALGLRLGGGTRLGALSGDSRDWLKRPARTQHANSGKVLVLGDDTRSFLVIVRSLGRQGIKVHAAPANFRSPALRSRYIAAIHDLPPYMGNGAAWLDATEALLRAERFDLVIPCTETTLLPLQTHRAPLQQWARLAIPDDKAIAVLFDKHATRELARGLNVPVASGRLLRPDDTAESMLAEFGSPIVIKPRRSYSLETLAARGAAQVVRDAATLERVLNGARPEETLAEQFFPGQGVGVSLLASNGRVLQAFEHHRIRELAGASFYRISAHLTPELVRYCEAMVAAVSYTGVAMFEFKQNQSDGAILLEVNARPWGSMPLSVAAGVDFPHRWFQLLTSGEETPPMAYRIGLYGRNLLPDLYSWLKEAAAERRGPVATGLLLVRRGAELFRVVTGREVHDVLVHDDPLPGLAELSELRTAVVKRVKPLVPGDAARQRRRVRKQVARGVRDSVGSPHLLFVCQGNICRSPFAEALLRTRLGSNSAITISSAGVIPRSGRAPPALGLQAASAFDIDLSAHRSSWLTPSMVEGATLLIVFEERDRAAVFDRYPELKIPVIRLADLDRPGEIGDPIAGGPAEFRNCYSQIAAGVAELAALLS